ncbi:MAG: ribose 1,5-bisphosphate isomerase [Candidatus Aquicultor secundus]|uniref:Thiamine thiazole synthase n=1 Tax=Candidatus Aquicultor secundus TaxID=1973895 RepID=A0A2M7T770_9ACTN|nr:sulfide-dependent adenosine diphosphate thiazole synthase [Candidatus Aquicultor secundus]NCO66395.1 thiazole biosynthesis protein [Solirubrobacter sp.]OIO84310.1 MAG: ribose 1,5-bisphosphate isomerase [Candidatus Aquicultor secundus]PIU27024.1 MAG: ribose 1,5-bisphosphate isomerase [Candidatus Aquicultor secundus]PIW21519.1 MAG: ribose 1,5-bisphosphate isomerase [Candidatus Aquicultor secundus]PIX52297.1 MAG: ribose 1,5-bisphosphate isomerase [Candidatus Aquicultor secundus]
MEGKTIFAPVGEASVTRAIVGEFLGEFLDYVESDVIVVGAGPSGLMAAMDMANSGLKVVVIESNNYLGGGFWAGGYLMNKVTFRAPSEEILEELGIPYKEIEPGHFVSDSPHACSRLIAAACDAGAKIINTTRVEDLVVRDDAVRGVVMNWSAVSYMPKAIGCVDPVAMESRVVIDATGHHSSIVGYLEKRGILTMPGEANMWVERSEDGVVEKTGFVYPGLLVAGMAVATVYGLPRMGPTFGGMLLSGRKAAKTAIESLELMKSPKA